MKDRSHDPDDPPPIDDIAVLGIDAAWTSHNPSGVSLWQRRQGRWKCVRVSPSYAAFSGTIAEPDCHQVDVKKILSTCRSLIGDCPIAVVGVDMPIGKGPITGRRAADNEVSKRFSKQHCATHSPTPTRPGKVGELLSTQFSEAGFKPVFEANAIAPALIEVYPHVSLLAIARYGCPTGRPYNENIRLPYKASKTKTYWKHVPIADRKKRLILVWRDIMARLEQFADISSVYKLPDNLEGLSFEALKPYEDQIDALVCAWTATQFVEGRLVPMGDQDSAIWVPKELVQ